MKAAAKKGTKESKAKPALKALGGLATSALELLAKKGPMTRGELSEALDGSFIGG